MDAGTPRRWGEAALVGIALYVAIDVALVFLRPSLSVLHNAESDYGSAGGWGWLMNVNFGLRCLLSLAALGALALVARDRRRLRVGLLALTVWALGSGLLAFFPDDPVGTTLKPSGKVHLVLAFVAFAGILVGSFATTRGLRDDERFAPVRRALYALALLGLLAVLALGHAHLRAHSLGALYEKLFLAFELAWIGLLALQVSRVAEAPA